MKKSLSESLRSEWNLNKNGNLKPEDVTPGSHKLVWWRCSKNKNHEWLAPVYSRSAGRGCPYCASKIVSEDNCLATKNPKLAQEWHPIRNGTLTPSDVVPSSNKKIWWQCRKNKDHVWQATIANRSHGTGCPYCAGKKVINDNCLAAKYPNLAKEWHPRKNDKLTPNDVTPGSREKVWWQCSKNKNHEWQSSINARTSGHGCPYCAGQKSSKDNCLATLHPKIAKEWHPAKNVKLTPKDVTPGSGRKVWWQCSKNKDHIWRTSVNSRTRGTGCPYCAGKKVSKDNCLAYRYPQIAKEWHPAKNEKLTPFDVTSGSGKRAWWQCQKNKNHVWLSSTNDRTHGYGCPYCSGQKVSKDNCLAFRYPQISKEWHQAKNGKLTPNDVTPGSRKKVWWRCKNNRNHIWSAAIHNRTNGTGCPICSRKRQKQ